MDLEWGSRLIVEAEEVDRAGSDDAGGLPGSGGRGQVGGGWEGGEKNGWCSERVKVERESKVSGEIERCWNDWGWSWGSAGYRQLDEAESTESTAVILLSTEFRTG